jgi:hypothetical protein
MHLLAILITWSANNIAFLATKHGMILLAPVEHVYFTNIHLYNCFFCKERFFITNPPSQT